MPENKLAGVRIMEPRDFDVPGVVARAVAKLVQQAIDTGVAHGAPVDLSTLELRGSVDDLVPGALHLEVRARGIAHESGQLAPVFGRSERAARRG